MRAFLETTFGPNEFEIVDQAFSYWLAQHQVLKNSPDAELAAAILMTLYREGHRTRSTLEAAMAKHRGLIDLSHLASGS
jgi:hypothetical protein